MGYTILVPKFYFTFRPQRFMSGCILMIARRTRKEAEVQAYEWYEKQIDESFSEKEFRDYEQAKTIQG